jgi:hypothetical protein
MPTEIAVIVSIAVFLLVMSMAPLVYLQRMNIRLLDTIDKFQRDHSREATEKLAHKTRVETGDHMTAGQLLQHSNAYDIRAGQTVGTSFQGAEVPTMEDEEIDQEQVMGAHQEAERLYGDKGPGGEEL